jgi:hypothetical protein
LSRELGPSIEDFFLARSVEVADRVVDKRDRVVKNLVRRLSRPEGDQEISFPLELNPPRLAQERGKVADIEIEGPLVKERNGKGRADLA